jgi:CBS domain-containing protein
MNEQGGRMKAYKNETEWFENTVRVDQVMTPMPLTISPDATLDEAKSLMRFYQISHLPVLDEGELAGLISHQDMLTASATYGSNGLMVRYAMKPDPYTVASGDPFDRVLSEMIEQKIASALVVTEEGDVVGIFTANDALHMLRAFVMLGASEIEAEEHETASNEFAAKKINGGESYASV